MTTNPRFTAAIATPLLVLAIAVQRALELRVAKSNERWARERGAVEYGREHYPLFFLLHGGWLASLLLEGRRQHRPVSWAWLLVWLVMQPTRYLVIRTLGPLWNTRILIVPGEKRVTRGAFRFVRHPNYLVVATELLSGPLAVRAPRTAIVFSVLNALLLLLLRIPAEERALQEYARTEPTAVTSTA
ncbi:isoprenylcysteine carboxyl methyltransferase family protein [Deinococcus yavapaiensis]|uniref:Methyltransferase n=1 Tax=Deinococcus yavapaiensis KR-236 TaxID=694435 RepID=A0A318S9B3_9DEIO|nr:isoprenylcysteine carboxylmethyltransferase family protein [Deinococcus yavapaiensis]PYE54577.1 methyltransferase [Deinococcus yavapaiensis KR-236]